jgi:hypothetical protein
MEIDIDSYLKKNRKNIAKNRKENNMTPFGVASSLRRIIAGVSPVNMFSSE